MMKIETIGMYEWVVDENGRYISFRPVDAVPVVRGEWIEGETFNFCGEQKFPATCSACGRSALDEPWNFCPNCGADMRGR